MAIDRREAVLAGLGAWAGAAMSAQAAADPLAGAALYADVKTYSDLGEHRTGTAGDAAATVWLETALKAAGYAIERQSFDYPVFELGQAGLKLGGREIAGFPYWTPAAAPAGGLTAPLSLAPAPGKILVVSLPPGAGAGLNAPPPKLISDGAASGVAAVVAITENPLGEMSVLNRAAKAAPWPVPVLLVAGREGAGLKAAAEAGQAATLRLEGATVTRTAHNVIGRRVRPGKHLVVSTPKSGWLHCAGERGSGVAIWLGLARRLAATEHNIMLVATSGHEFDGYGGHIFTETLAPKPADTKLWLHIGANVAAYDFALQDGKIVRQAGPRADRLLACSDGLMAAAAKAFAGQPGYETPFDIDERKPPGEVALFQSLGYAPLIGVVAGHPLHHTWRDLPDVTDGKMLEPVARGLAAMIVEA